MQLSPRIKEEFCGFQPRASSSSSLPLLLISSNSFHWFYLCFQLSHTSVLFLFTDPVRSAAWDQDLMAELQEISSGGLN